MAISLYIDRAEVMKHKQRCSYCGKQLYKFGFSSEEEHKKQGPVENYCQRGAYIGLNDIDPNLPSIFSLGCKGKRSDLIFVPGAKK